MKLDKNGAPMTGVIDNELYRKVFWPNGMVFGKGTGIASV